MHEVSVWVDQFLGAISGHGRFVRSLCSEMSQSWPASKPVSWIQPGTTYFDREYLPLSCCKVKMFETTYHLYDLGEAAWGAFHKAHVLNELDFQPALSGMIVVINRATVLYWLEITSDMGYKPFASVGGIDFSWFEKQRLPYVIAATGYQGLKEEKEMGQLRKALKLSSNIPMIPGPSLSDSDPLSFDTKHANEVLTVLHDTLKSED